MADLLIVDDDHDVADVLRDILVALGHTARVAHDGREGLTLLEERPPDLLLLDVEMPVLDGPGMATRMLLHDAGLERIPVILVSGAADLHRIALRVGTPYFLAKPYSITALQEILATALTERRPATPSP